MISINTKLTLLVLALPICVLLLLDLVMSYYFKTSIEVSALLSAILVFLLVWERLRDSLSKKLEYLHKNVLFELYDGFRSDYNLFYRKDEIKKARIDLEKYGRFLIVPLYPTKLLERIDGFLFLHDTFYGKLQQISELAEKKLGKSFNKGTFWHYLDFDPVNWSKPSYEEEKHYIETAQLIVKEQLKLIDETKNLHEKLKRTRKQIYEKIEDFLKSNNLRLELEPSHISYR